MMTLDQTITALKEASRQMRDAADQFDKAVDGLGLFVARELERADARLFRQR